MPWFIEKIAKNIIKFNFKEIINYLIYSEAVHEAMTIQTVEGFQQKALASITFFSSIGISSLSMFGHLFNIVDVAQEINLYSFLNIDKPLNLEGLLDFLSEFRFYKYFTIFGKLPLPVRNDTGKNITKIQSDQEPSPMFLKKGLTSSFLSNVATVLVFLILTPLLLLLFIGLVNAIAKRRRKKASKKALRKSNNFLRKVKQSTFRQLLNKIWEKRNIILINILFSLFLSSLQEVQFFFALQMVNISFSNTYNIISFSCSVAWIIYEVIILFYIIKVYLSMNPNVANKINIKKGITIYILKKNKDKLKNELGSFQSKAIRYDKKQKEKYSFFLA